MKKIYVGNLPWSATDASLQEAFSAFGEVTSASVVTDRETGRSRGFGFIEMEDGADADKAIRGLDGRDLDGRAMRVNEARPKERRERSNW
jgi:RNA recognition motif-containing protein